MNMKSVLKNQLIKKTGLIMAVFSLFVLASCGDDDTETPAPNVPTITVSTEVNGEARTSPVSTTPGDEVTFNVAIDAAGGFNTYRVYLSVDGGESTVVNTTSRTDIGVDAGTITVNLSSDLTVTSEMVELGRPGFIFVQLIPPSKVTCNLE